MTAAVEVDDLTRRFGALTAVDGLSFEVAQGELFGLVGPDGAGKTTTLRMLAGVLRPTSGDARIEGVSVARSPEEVKHHTAYMSQRFGLYADLTVEENLAFYADLFGVPAAERRERVARLYEFSRLGPFRRRLAGQLSGGMKQKLGLSCALVHQPRVLLLDEPTFGVDPVSRRDLWLIVHEMVSEGVTTLVSTAYLDEAERFDRLALLAGGRTVALDTPTALQRSLPVELLELTAGDARRAREVAAAVPGVERASLFGDRLHLEVDDAEATGPRLHRALAEAGLGDVELARLEPSLEDVFIHLAGDDGAGGADSAADAAGGAG